MAVVNACRDCGREFPTAGLLIGHAQAEGHCSMVPAVDPRDDYRRAAEDERAEAERGFADWLAS